MADFVSFTQISLLLVFMCWTTGSIGATFSFEEEFLLMKENYIQMKETVKNLESKVTELKTKVQDQDLLLFELLREKNEHVKPNSDSALLTSQAVAINGLPSSCDDLKVIGHTLNGFYSVMGSAMMESVYCDFTKQPSDADFQKWIGFVDVKSAPVHFYVQRNGNVISTGTPITFNNAVVNNGNAMNLMTGKFIAPRQGTYFFTFTGLAAFPVSSSIRVYFEIIILLNGVKIGKALVNEANTVYNQLSPMTLQSTLNLKRDDQVWVEIDMMSQDVYMYDSQSHLTHFTGILLEEEIVASI